MQRHSIFFLVVFAGTIPLNVRADVFERDWNAPGDGLLTYDDVNQREWLDLTESRLVQLPGENLEEKYQSAISETTVGGVFEGFQSATRTDLLALAESAGIDTSTQDLSVNQEPVTVLVELLGGRMGYLDEVSPVDSARINGRLIASPLANVAGLSFSTFVDTEIGTRIIGAYLYRQAVPEPGTLGLTLLALCVLKTRIRKDAANVRRSGI